MGFSDFQLNAYSFSGNMNVIDEPKRGKQKMKNVVMSKLDSFGD